MPDTMIEQQRPAAPANRSVEVAELAKALATTQGAFKPIERNREVEVKTEKGYTYTFKYATLDNVMAAVQPALSANGLALTHLTNGAKLVSMLLHASGQWISSEWPLGTPDGRNRMQAIGSAQTYGQRYNVRLLLNLASEEDDDGNAADGNTIQKQKDHKPGASGSAASGKDFRPDGPRRMPTSNYSEDARHDGTLDTTRQKGTLPGAAGKNGNGNGDALKKIEWCRKAREMFKLAQTKDELTSWWKAERERLDIIETAIPTEYESLLAAYDAAIERTARA